MPVPSKVALLPDALRVELEQWISTHGFAGYKTAEAWLAERGRMMGLDVALLPKRSALQDYGSKLKRKMAAIADATRGAKLIAQFAPDDEGAMNEVMIRLIQEKLFSILVELNIEPKLIDISSLARSVADLTRASVTQKKWRQSMREKAEAAATQVVKIVTKGGLTKGAVETIRRQILGIAA
jgi:hypothetical protein